MPGSSEVEVFLSCPENSSCQISAVNIKVRVNNTKFRWSQLCLAGVWKVWAQSSCAKACCGAVHGAGMNGSLWLFLNACSCLHLCSCGTSSLTNQQCPHLKSVFSQVQSNSWKSSSSYPGYFWSRVVLTWGKQVSQQTFHISQRCDGRRCEPDSGPGQTGISFLKFCGKFMSLIQSENPLDEAKLVCDLHRVELCWVNLHLRASHHYFALRMIQCTWDKLSWQYNGNKVECCISNIVSLWCVMTAYHSQCH